MKTFLYLIALLLSLPNLLAGLALAVLEHTFATRNPLLIILNFFEAAFWAVPVAAAALLVLVMAGCFFETRAYAALVALALNAVALTLVLVRVGSPRDAYEGALFLPVAIATIAFGWLAWREFTLR
jgi:hypothetical protein